MNEPSNLNPEIIFNNFKQTPETEMKQSKIPSFRNSEFNPLIDFNVNSTQNQDSDELNSSEMISKMITSARNLQILFIDDVVYDINTTFHLDQSTNFSLFDESERRFDASLVPKVLCSNISYAIPVRKSANATQGSGAHSVESSVGSNDPDCCHLNRAAANNGGSDNKDSVTGPINNRKDNDDDDEVIEVEPVTIYICCNNVNQQINGVRGFSIQRRISTNIFAVNHANWNTFGAAVFRVWMQQNGIVNSQLPWTLSREGIAQPLECWPGFEAFFGRLEGIHFTDMYNRPRNRSFDSVRARLNCVLLAPWQKQ